MASKLCNIQDLDLESLDEARTRVCLSPIRSGYMQFDGYTMPESFRHVRQRIANFNVYDDDVWVTSYPKCGTTWVQEIVWCICNNFDFNKAQDIDLDKRFPFLEYETCFYTEDPVLLQNEPGIVHKSVQIAASMPKPRFIKSHLPWDLLPIEMRDFKKKPKIIHVARNPKDVCVSYYHHSRLMEGFTGDFDLFWKLFITGKLNFAPVLDNILSYWQHQNRENVLFIKYEEMKSDITAVIKKIVGFLNKPMTDKQLKDLKHHVSFEVMKNNPSTQHNPVVEYLRKCGAVINSSGSFMRSGKAGGYQDLINEQLEQVFDEWIEKELHNTDLQL